MDLKEFLKGKSLPERESFALRCGTTLRHLNNVAYGCKTCGESLALNVDRESNGEVSCETMRPDVDWAYLRGKTPVPVSTNTGTHG